jgi:hypothetical protein
MQPREHRLRAVRAPDLDREMLHPAIVGAVDVQPTCLRGLHRQARGGDGHQVMVRREVLGGGIGGEAGQPVRIGEGGRRRRSRRPGRRAEAAPISPAGSPGDGASRPPPARSAAGLSSVPSDHARVGQVGQPRRVGVRRHHDPRDVAVIGARLERARAPCGDRHDGGGPSARSAATRSAPAVSAASTTRPPRPWR